MAAKLLAEAGWQPKDGVLTNAAGDAAHSRVSARAARFRAHRAALHREIWRSSDQGQRAHRGHLAIPAAASTPSTSTSSSSPSPSRCRPATSSATIWGSDAAGKEGSRNVIGIKNPAIDKLIDKIILAKDRAELVAATRALDRVLLWNHYVVPQWRTPFERVAMWDMFGRPAKLPSRRSSFLRVWWCDERLPNGLPTGAGRAGAAQADNARVYDADARSCLWMLALLLGMFLGAASAQAADRAWAVGLRRAQVSGRFQAFRMGQPRRAERRAPRHRSAPAARTTFDSFNAFILKGDAAQGLDLLFDSLMARVHRRARRRLRSRRALRRAGARSRRRHVPPASRGQVRRRHDDHLRRRRLQLRYPQGEGPPAIFAAQLRDIATRGGGRYATVRFDFTGALTRDLPLVAAGLPILSKAYYATREFDQTTLDPPLGSGPYRIGEFKQGAFVSYRGAKTTGPRICP